jgi:sulfate/thiosulfate transport system permease protein
VASLTAGRSRYGLRAVALAYVAALVLIPLVVVAWRTIQQGGDAFWSAISSPQAVEAFRLTAIVAGLAVVINTLFGVGAALLLTRYRFPGKRLLGVLIDLPMSVSPIVVGLALVLVYGPNNGWFGVPLHNGGIEIIYAVPGMVLATTFVSLPLVVREVVPVLEDEGLDQEQAARVLGASALQRFVRITLPTIKWALAYGVVLSIARSIGEFGAVKVVSGNISGSGQTQTATLYVDERVEQLEPGAYQVSLVLIAVAVVAIVIVSLIRPKEHLT